MDQMPTLAYSNNFKRLGEYKKYKIYNQVTCRGWYVSRGEAALYATLRDHHPVAMTYSIMMKRG